MSRRYLLDQNKTPLFDAVRKFADWDPVPFFIPSHKMGAGIDPRFKSFAGENIFKIDLSEVRWTDDFHGASSSIKEAQELAADAWGAAQSHFLVNGTSGGIIAAICSVCGEGDRIILPRNAHKSAVYGLVASGAEPVYIMPEIDEGRGLVLGLAPEALEQAFEQCSGRCNRAAAASDQAIRQHSGRCNRAAAASDQAIRQHSGRCNRAGGSFPDSIARAPAKAVFTVSPTYYGVMSDTKALAETAHRYGAALIADEAHGNHMYFSERLPKGALELGADIVCQSTHKMSGALTQASMLHLGKGAEQRVDPGKVRANLSMFQTTSPSYILLASLDAARSYIATQGEALLDGVLDALEKARAEIMQLPGIEVLGALGESGEQHERPALLSSEGAQGRCLTTLYEPTRLVVSARGLGIDGYELFRILREEYGIECEFADPYWCVCVAGLGTTAAHAEALAEALAQVSRGCGDGFQSQGGILPPVPPLRMTPREAWFAEKEAVPFEAACDRVSAEMVVPYPPGIPVLCPGESVTGEVHAFLAEQRSQGRHLHCSAGDALETLSVVK
ncbi:MAG: hypothetical protein FWG03_02065 [Clostridiales bacterium]|nr:hypothetical protein [Clostridiales bacterium]